MEAQNMLEAKSLAKHTQTDAAVNAPRLWGELPLACRPARQARAPAALGIRAVTVMVLLFLPWAFAQPIIRTHPTNTSVSLGGTAKLTAYATSTNSAVAYLWWFKDAPLDTVANPSAATRFLYLTNVTLANGGPYFVVASDTSGLSTNSQVATLTVDPTFTKITTGLVVTDLGGWEGSNWWDFDKDGFLDLYVANTTGSGTVTDALYRNNGDGTFTKVTNTISTTRGRSGGRSL